MICNHVLECNSSECEHRTPHVQNAFCHDGQCRWAGDTRCIPESKREQILALMNSENWDNLSNDLVADAIMAIFEEDQ